MPNENVFSADPVNEDISADLLIGEGKKYKTADDLAKAYANADNHIHDLRADLARIKAENELLKANKNREDDPDDGNRRDDPPNPTPNNPAPNDEEFRNNLRREIEELDQERRAAQNVEAAAQRLVEHFGDTAKANEAIRRRAAELGVSAEWLRDAAARSPQAFYASMGLTEPNNANPRMTPAPRSEVNLDRGNANRGEKRYRDFAELRQTDKKKYYSVEVQREMQELAKKLGPAFYE